MSYPSRFRYSPKQTAFSYVITITSLANGHNDALKLILQKGHHVETRDSSGLTALMLACKYNKYDIIKILVENFADLFVVDKAGMTSAHFAAIGDNAVALQALAEAAQLEFLLAKDEIDVASTASEDIQAIQLSNEVIQADKSARHKSSSSLTPSSQNPRTQGGGGSLAGCKKGNKSVVTEASEVSSAANPLDVINSPAKNGLRPIHLAADADAVGALEFLIFTGIDVSTQRVLVAFICMF